MSRHRSLLVVAAIIAMVGTGAIVAVMAPGGGPTPPRAPSSARSSVDTIPPMPAPATGTSFRDFVFETSVITAPTATKAQSKLWFAHDRWWAGLFQPASDRLNIFRLDWDSQIWQDTGVLIDERSDADPDFLWTGEHLYVISAGPRAYERHAGRVLRFSFVEADDRFELDQNFPITISGTGTPAAVMDVDSVGRLWVAFSAGGRIWVAHSLDHDVDWGVPFELPVAGSFVDDDDIASIVAFGPGRIGVMWSNQAADSVYFSWRRDDDPPDVWSEPEVVVDGLGSSDDHINLKGYPTADGIGVVAALKTSLDRGLRANPLSPQILLAVRGHDDGWTTHMVSQVRDRHTRAVVMVDASARVFYVAATAPIGGGAIYYKRSPMDRISFDTGRGEVLLQSASDTRINNASATKQFLTAGSGLLVVASDDDTGRYLHGVLDLGSGLPPADPDDPGRLGIPDPPDPLSPVVLFQNDFEPWAVGPADGTGWSVRPEDPPGSLTVADDGDGGRVLRVTRTRAPSIRACRSFSEFPEGQLTIDARVRFSRLGSTDSQLVLLRGSGGEAGGVRVAPTGSVSWFDGSTKARSASRLVAGRWYRVSVTVDQGARTYDFAITTDRGEPIIRRTGLAWRSSDVRFVRTLCLQSAEGTARQDLDLSDARVLAQVAP